MAAGVIPYSINAPFWSDGAQKERFLALPPTARIAAGEKPENAWTFDDGAVTVKSFALDLEGARKYIETRVVVKQQDHWVGYSMCGTTRRRTRRWWRPAGSRRLIG